MRRPSLPIVYEGNGLGAGSGAFDRSPFATNLAREGRSEEKCSSGANLLDTPCVIRTEPADEESNKPGSSENSVDSKPFLGCPSDESKPGSTDTPDERKYFLKTHERDSAEELMMQLRVIRTFQRRETRTHSLPEKSQPIMGSNMVGLQLPGATPSRRASLFPAHISSPRRGSYFPEAVGHRIHSFATETNNRLINSFNIVSKSIAHATHGNSKDPIMEGWVSKLVLVF